MNDRSKELGQWSRRERKRMGLSQQAVADALSISRQAFVRAEGGHRPFTYDEGWLLIEVLGRFDSQSVAEAPPLPPSRRSGVTRRGPYAGGPVR